MLRLQCGFEHTPPAHKASFILVASENSSLTRFRLLAVRGRTGGSGQRPGHVKTRIMRASHCSRRQIAIQMEVLREPPHHGIDRFAARISCSNIRAPPLASPHKPSASKRASKPAYGTGELFGDAPNVAARAQARAEPDSVVVTTRVQQYVAGMFVVEGKRQS